MHQTTTQGGVTDECGREHTGGHHYNITYWEVFNEPIAEHSHTKENYTASFDAIVQGIRRWADPEKKIKFVGINLANIRSKEEVGDFRHIPCSGPLRVLVHKMPLALQLYRVDAQAE